MVGVEEDETMNTKWFREKSCQSNDGCCKQEIEIIIRLANDSETELDGTTNRMKHALE
jgi:hypothetical protein